MLYDTARNYPERAMDFMDPKPISEYISQIKHWNIDEYPADITFSFGREHINAWMFEPLDGLVFGTCGPKGIDEDIIRKVNCDAPMLIFILLLDGHCSIKFEKKGKALTIEKNMFAWCDWSGAQSISTLPRQESYCHVSFSITLEAFFTHFGKANGADLLAMLRNSQLHAEKNTAYVSGVASPELITAGRRFLNAPKGSALGALELKASALDFFSKMMRNVVEYKEARAIAICERDYEAIQRLKTQLESDITASVNVQKVCSTIGMSQSKASLLFKQLYNTTMGRYQHQCRMAHAHKMLSSRKLNVSECAYELGYSNIGHFIAAFRKHYGITPGEALAEGQMKTPLEA